MKKNKFSLKRQEKPSRLFDVTNHTLILWVFVSFVARHRCLAAASQSLIGKLY